MTSKGAQAVLDTPQILALVQQALNDFEVVSLSSSIRRAIRIANLLGDSQTAVRLSLEIRSHGGAKFMQSANLMKYYLPASKESSGSNGGSNGPAEKALEEYITDRSPSKAEMVWCHTVSELEDLASKPSLEEGVHGEILEWRFIARQIVERTLNQTFALLCRWEREFTQSHTHEEIYAGYSQQPQSLLRDDTSRVLESP
jgi:hypothetical protein